MKKTYELPKAEKMAFDYSDVVVASGTQCVNTTTITYLESTSTTCNDITVTHEKTHSK